jgi:hypothetical protein
LISATNVPGSATIIADLLLNHTGKRRCRHRFAEQKHNDNQGQYNAPLVPADSLLSFSARIEVPGLCGLVLLDLHLRSEDLPLAISHGRPLQALKLFALCRGLA